MNTQTVKLDVTKRPAVMPVIYLGQGDKNGTTLIADIYDNGAALTLTGYTVKFQMKQPHDAGYYNVTGTVSGSTATFAIDENYAAAVAGVTECAYVEVLSGSTVICSTNRMRVVVLEGATEGVDPSTMYDNGLNDAIARANTAAEAAEGVVLQDVPTMTENVKGGAKLGSGLEVTSSVLSLDLVDSATGTSVTADDASYLEGLTIDGKAVQNGTPTPSAPADIQVVEGVNIIPNPTVRTVSSNYVTYSVASDGLITVSGTASTTTRFSLYSSINFDLPAGTYTMSKSSGSNARVYIDGNTSTSAVTKTENSSFSTSTLKIQINSGVSVNESFYVQLEKGSTATPYIPYGSLGLKVNSTITPIDLQGNVLASLPDGTKDELTVDSAGHVVKQNRVGVVNLGDLTWTKASGYNEFRAAWTSNPTVPLPKIYGSTVTSNLICNIYQARSSSETYQGAKNGISAATYFFSVGDDTGYADATAFTNSLTGAVLYYELATPTTTDLGYIDPPTIADGAAISITAQVTPTITASWWARGAAAIATAIKALRDDLLARIEAIETAIADL